jgi:hypothetical protein
MTENTYYKPRLVIGDKEIFSGMSGSVTMAGNSQANTCQCTLTDPEFQNARLYNKELKVYLNYGSDDGVPIFRGFIKEVRPSDAKTSITAIDPRMFITGSNSRLVELTDDNNYDGYSLGGFLYDFIDTMVNTDDTYIGLDLIRDTSPIVSMSGVRTPPASVYEIMKKELKKAKDNDDIENPLTYFVDMIDDGKKSNITFIKEKLLTEAPSLYMSFSDGLKSYTYKRRAPVTYAVGGGSTFQYGNEPRGSVGIKVSGKFKDKNEARTEAIHEVLLSNREIDEITIQCNKGHYASLGSIVNLKTEIEDINGNHRITAKTIAFSKGGLTLSLSLNKKPIVLSSYI